MKQDAKGTLRWYKLKAAQGSPQAQVNLGFKKPEVLGNKHAAQALKVLSNYK